ncbi:MAG: Formate hydrogenlyase transcriptional activator [Pedosphaera sp.]|nr:Formate hydrogenlyase transcriptional activator [Pedosphaera sp.]
MSATTDEDVTAAARKTIWEEGCEVAADQDHVSLSDGGDVQAAELSTIDQGLPGLLYELAVRLPTQSEIQALCVWLYEPVQQSVRLHVLMADLPAGLKVGMDFPVADSIASWVWKRQLPITVNTEAETRFPKFAKALLKGGIRSFCGVPLMIASRKIGVLGVASTKRDAFRNFNLQFMQRGCPKGAGDGHKLPVFRGAEESMQLSGQSLSEDQFEDIIGRSALLRDVTGQIQIVAPTNSTVLILGETGTGKELMARAVHNRSLRCDRPLVRVNCAAIPSGLLESELFGHERGAFTGAIARKLGRFELANGGTIFLDEIGDIPPELQPKLLRVLQEQEFERLGSTHTTRVDVRVVAATSRNLPQMVANREFRSDLYYRLNVFPVRLPTLRERPGDIPLLVHHFVDQSAKKIGKSIDHVPIEAMGVMVRYPWPGNVRELQNFIERAVILSPGKVLRPPLVELRESVIAMDPSFAQNDTPRAITLNDAARDHILQALAETNWVIGGPKGAAARLGLQRTTLISKMQKLGIFRAQA